jgi:hypothetical protein
VDKRKGLVMRYWFAFGIALLAGVSIAMAG